jgi:hypothetical protein
VLLPRPPLREGYLLSGHFPSFLLWPTSLIRPLLGPTSVSFPLAAVILPFVTPGLSVRVVSGPPRGVPPFRSLLHAAPCCGPALPFIPNSLPSDSACSPSPSPCAPSLWEPGRTRTALRLDHTPNRPLPPRLCTVKLTPGWPQLVVSVGIGVA